MPIIGSSLILRAMSLYRVFFYAEIAANTIRHPSFPIRNHTFALLSPRAAASEGKSK